MLSTNDNSIMEEHIQRAAQRIHATLGELIAGNVPATSHALSDFAVLYALGMLQQQLQMKQHGFEQANPEAAEHALSALLDADPSAVEALLGSSVLDAVRAAILAIAETD